MGKIATDETLQRVARALEQNVKEASLVRENGEYNIGEFFKYRASTEIYSVDIPQYSNTSTTTCIKSDANAGLTITPSTATSANTDDYAGLSTFACMMGNITVDDDGTPHVTAIAGDSYYAKDGSNGDVFTIAPVLYWSFTDLGNGYDRLSISETCYPWMQPQPNAKLPDGSLRKFMCYASYAGSKVDSKLCSVSGKPLWNRSYSHNTSHGTMVTAKGKGWGGKTVGDDWYVYVMYMIKYANKSSQNVFGGCTEYDLHIPITVAESGVQRVIVSTANAANILVGSTLMYGTTTSAANSRNSTSSYDIFDMAVVTKKETYDSDNVAVYVNTSATFNTTVGTYLVSAPYYSGYCDTVRGTDGSPVNPKNSTEPFKIQNIEVMVGAYEVLSDIILKGSPTQEVYRCYDSASYSTSITDNYVKIGEYTGTNTGWNYTKDVINADGLLLPQGYDATTSTGNGDGWSLPTVSTSPYEWLGFGDMSSYSTAGLRCVIGNDALSFAYWDVAGRLSAISRSAV
jgi:hypothetical protein